MVTCPFGSLSQWHPREGPPLTAHEWMCETRSTLAPLAVRPDAHGEMPIRLAQPVAPARRPVNA